MNKVNFPQAIDGYFLFARARHLSEYTIRDYRNTFKKFRSFIGDEIFLDEIGSSDIQSFLAMQDEVKKKTVLNYHTGLSALWTWAVAEKLVSEHIVQAVPRPKPEKKEILPFTEVEVKALFSTLGRSRTYERPGKKKTSHTLPEKARNRVILLLLLDTGLRATELAELKLHQIDRRNQRVQVMGKGAKERSVPFSARTAQALWHYMTSRKEFTQGDYLFISKTKRHLNRHSLRKMLESLGERAGVSHVHPHRFRHTFAIQYLRNGGDPYTLQMMLGHSTLEMVKTYLRLAQVDLDIAHRRASPVDNWGL